VHFCHEKRWSIKDFACVVVDEAQDVSPIRLAILTLLSNRVVAVGDRRQAIYKFAGALSDALDVIQARFDAVCCPLSVTWRCSEAVVDQAERILGEKFLFARAGAPKGQVAVIGSVLNADLDQRSMVLCRTNKPLVMLAVTLLKQRIPFRMLSDFPEKLVKKFKKLLVHFDGGMASLKREVFMHYEEILSKVKNPNVQARYEDERDTLLALASDSGSPQEVLEKLQDIVNSKSGVLLTTGHKAKGLEAESVYIIETDLIPAPWVDSNSVEDMQQERNLHYVMATRAKTSLYYVGAMPCQ
jgi:superfamily I DNA/RNA helicase